MKQCSLTLGLVGPALLTLAVLSAGCGGSGAGVLSTTPLPTSVTEPTPIVSPTSAAPTPTTADEPWTTETRASSTDTNAPEGAATERVVFTRVRSLAPA